MTTAHVEMLGWHFIRDDRTLGYDMQCVTVQEGTTYRVDPPVAMCERGLHASKRALDAMRYAHGAVVCRVKLGGEIIHDTDKACATERTVLWLADTTRVLHEFALWCAEQALQRERDAGREPDQRSWAALEVKRRWLDGLATDDELAAAEAAAEAARAAAWDAAWDAAEATAWGAARAATEAAAEAAAEAATEAAAWDAARAAAWDAAWDAARDAARAAAWDATEAAAWGTARAAAWGAARAAARAAAEAAARAAAEAARAAAWDAAWDAARAAAWDAAWDAQNAELERRLMTLV